MAEINMFEKVKGIGSIVKGGIVGSGAGPAKNLTKQIEGKMEEKSRLYGYIGMEVWDLYENGKVEPVPELAGYFEKMNTINEEIQELNAKKQAYELQTTNKVTCVCGFTVTAENKFCPRCGAPIDNGMITCTCGRQVSKDMQFCGFCGNNVQNMLETGNPVMMQPNVPPRAMKQCICGAQVPEGQFMCMECGRKIAD